MGGVGVGRGDSRRTATMSASPRANPRDRSHTGGKHSKIVKKGDMAAGSELIRVTEEVLNDFKNSKTMWESMLKEASRYHAALEALTDASKNFTSAFKNIEASTKHSSPDLGRAILQVVQAQEEIEENRGFMCQVLMNG